MFRNMNHIRKMMTTVCLVREEYICLWIFVLNFFMITMLQPGEFGPIFKSLCALQDETTEAFLTWTFLAIPLLEGYTSNVNHYITGAKRKKFIFAINFKLQCSFSELT